MVHRAKDWALARLSLPPELEAQRVAGWDLTQMVTRLKGFVQENACRFQPRRSKMELQVIQAHSLHCSIERLHSHTIRECNTAQP